MNKSNKTHEFSQINIYNTHYSFFLSRGSSLFFYIYIARLNDWYSFFLSLSCTDSLDFELLIKLQSNSQKKIKRKLIRKSKNILKNCWNFIAFFFFKFFNWSNINSQVVLSLSFNFKIYICERIIISKYYIKPNMISIFSRTEIKCLSLSFLSLFICFLSFILRQPKKKIYLKRKFYLTKLLKQWWIK